MLLTLGLPVLGLMILAVLITRAVETVAPESIVGLVATGAVAGLLCWAMSAAGFAWLYHAQDPEILTRIGLRPADGVAHFMTLGAQAALIWAPLVAITVVTAPRRWKTAVW